MKKLLAIDIMDVLEIENEEKAGAVLTARAELMDQIIEKSSNYYIAHFPKRDLESRFSLIQAYDYYNLVDSMAIKEGCNFYRARRGFEIVAYYGPYEESLFLYPISDDNARQLSDIIDSADFCESVVIDAEIAQYCY